MASSKVQIDDVRRAAKRAFGELAAVGEQPRTALADARVVVRIASREAILFEGRSIQRARRLALTVLRALSPLEPPGDRPSPSRRSPGLRLPRGHA